MKKKILAAVLSAATVLSLAGCGEKGNSSGDTGNSGNSGNAGNSSDAGNGGNSGGGTETPDVELKDDGAALSILAWSGNSDIRNMVELFCAEKGLTVDKDVIVVDCGDSGGKAADQYKTYLKGNDDADILCLESDWIMSYTNDDTLTAPLSAVGISESNFANPYSYTVEIGKDEKGVLKGASFQATPGGFVYNAKVAKDELGIENPEQMQERMKDWASAEALAKELKEKTGKALFSTEGGLWQVFQYGRSSAWVVDGKLVMGEAEDFYDIAKNFKDNGYMTDAEQWSDSWYPSVLNGDALGEFLSTWGMTDSDGGQLKNFTTKEGDDAEMAFCAGPQEYAWGGTWLGVASKCDNKTLAKEFIEFFTCNDDTMRKYVDKTGDFCNNSKVMSDVVSEGSHHNKFLVDGQSQFNYFLEKAGNINMTGKITKYDSKIKGFFNDSVNGYCKGTYATKEDAIEAFKDAVAKEYGDLIVE